MPKTPENSPINPERHKNYPPRFQPNRMTSSRFILYALFALSIGSTVSVVGSYVYSIFYDEVSSNQITPRLNFEAGETQATIDATQAARTPINAPQIPPD